MLKVLIRNGFGNDTLYIYNTVDDLFDMYWSDSIDMDVPANDDPVLSCEFAETEMYFDTFYDVVKAFGIDR